MANNDFNLITIGGGSGGVRASRIAANHGAKVAVIEENRLGGTCVLRGCVPKKLLVYGSKFADEFADAPHFGWDIGEPRHRWSHLITAKDRELDRLVGVYRALLDNAGVTTFNARGKITGAHSVEVGDKTYTADKILIAVGGWPSVVNLPGLRKHAITSNEALDLPERPEEVVIVGSGYIAVEFAGIFASLGSRTHLIFRADKVLRGFDADIRAQLMKSLTPRGVILHPSTGITSIEAQNGAKVVTCSDGTVITADQVMAATGRKPNTDGIGLEDVGVETNDKGAIIVDEAGQSSVSSIFAIGDVTDRINLTPVAVAEGHAFADTFFGNKARRINYDNVPSAVFSQPPIATVGVSEDKAIEQGIDVEVYLSRFNPMRNTISGRDDPTLMKVLVRRADNRVIGVHMLGEDAPEIIQGVAIAIKAGATKADFDATIGIHPTAAEEFVTMREPRKT